MSDWNSAQYLKFENERTQPSIDLVNRIPVKNPKMILDVGCGPGNSTQVLGNKFPDACILGIDSSENMVFTARKDYPDLNFRVCDAGAELFSLGNDFDIVFSNACIQWIPNHGQLLENMLGLLKKGGVLAVQVPMVDKETIHKIIGEVCRTQKWREYFQDKRVFRNLTGGGYFDVLSRISAEFSMWETVYYYIMKSHDDILEWYRGTGLRPYLNVLNDTEKGEFENNIMKRIVQCFKRQKNGEIIFRFPRFFLLLLQ